MGILTDFAMEAAAALLGVFAAVLLALWVERRRAATEEAKQVSLKEMRLEDVRDLMLMSVVKNTSEAKRLVDSLQKNDDDPYLFGVAFEYAVWEATRQEFVQLASLDERVFFSRFFDQTRRVSGLLDFHRQTRAQHEVSQTRTDPGDRLLFEGIMQHLKTAAEDLRLDGMVIVTDHGKSLHKRLLGLSG